MLSLYFLYLVLALMLNLYLYKAVYFDFFSCKYTIGSIYTPVTKRYSKQMFSINPHPILMEIVYIGAAEAS